MLGTGGHRQVRPERAVQPVTEYCKKQLSRDTNSASPQWRGVPRPLHSPTQREEVVVALRRLKNSRAVGPGDTAGELYKYGGGELVSLTQDLLSKVLTVHGEVEAMGEGYLLLLSKPGKLKTAESSRPLTLWGRKTLASTVLKGADESTYQVTSV